MTIRGAVSGPFVYPYPSFYPSCFLLSVRNPVQKSTCEETIVPISFNLYCKKDLPLLVYIAVPIIVKNSQRITLWVTTYLFLSTGKGSRHPILGLRLMKDIRKLSHAGHIVAVQSNIPSNGRAERCSERSRNTESKLKVSREVNLMKSIVFFVFLLMEMIAAPVCCQSRGVWPSKRVCKHYCRIKSIWKYGRSL